MASRLKALFTLAVSAPALLAGCISLPPTETPIPQLGNNGTDAAGKTLVIMLPGMGDRAETFEEQEFLDIGRRNGFDTIAVDAHFGYYRERSLLPRLREDVIQPARAKGYENIWLLGISLGGFGSLLYAEAHPGDIDGLILLAPYVGSDELVADLKAASSLHAWNPDGKDFPEHEINVWRWLQSETAKTGGKPILLGYGRSDRLAGAYGPLLPSLDGANVYARDGNHKWTTWTPLWSSIASDLGPRLNH
jgi:pimeloyl-ACP methyl ester carboxylesterase